MISTGAPVTNPVAGALRYASNRYLYRFIGGTNASSVLDFAYITSTTSSVGVTVDRRIAAANQLSAFNSQTRITKQAYIVSGGTLALSLGTTTIGGKFNLGGQRYISSGTSVYRAVMSGSIIGRRTVVV